ncbi:hypothetical protein SCG7086_CH_00070 [Chlamydiales bacterium SCGC AG-110-P3]|nr:hypothetical protein SCG7086_CH_00070 [Chlamydiales bacterium SCGC AG-110-P3]
MEYLFKILKYPQGTPASRLRKKRKQAFSTPKTILRPSQSNVIFECFRPQKCYPKMNHAKKRLRIWTDPKSRGVGTKRAIQYRSGRGVETRSTVVIIVKRNSKEILP